MKLPNITRQSISILVFIIATILANGCEQMSNEPAGKIGVLKNDPAPVRKLKNKINSLVGLRARLFAKIRDLSATRDSYKTQIAMLKSEIQEERRKNSVNSYQQAINNKRIGSNLSLIQRQLAYIDKIDELGYQLNMGTEELLYLEREARADLKITAVLDNKDELTQKIDQAIKSYEPYAGKFAFDKSQLRITSTEQIWNEIISKK